MKPTIVHEGKLRLDLGEPTQDVRVVVVGRPCGGLRLSVEVAYDDAMGEQNWTELHSQRQSVLEDAVIALAAKVHRDIETEIAVEKYSVADDLRNGGSRRMSAASGALGIPIPAGRCTWLKLPSMEVVPPGILQEGVPPGTRRCSAEEGHTSVHQWGAAPTHVAWAGEEDGR